MRLRQVVCTGLIMVPMVAVFGTVRAQSAAPVAPRRFGITAGINSSTFGGKDATNPTPSRRTGFMAGVLLVVPIRPSFAFQPELLYTMKGANIDDPSGSGGYKMTYIEVPLLARFDIATSGGVKPFLYAGPAVSFKMSCDIEIKSSFFNVNSTCEEFVSQFASTTKFKSIDYGAIIGGGLAFDLSGKTFSIGARYDHSFGKISEDTDPTVGNDVKHRVISVLATLEFPWGK